MRHGIGLPIVFIFLIAIATNFIQTIQVPLLSTIFCVAQSDTADSSQTDPCQFLIPDDDSDEVPNLSSLDTATVLSLKPVLVYVFHLTYLTSVSSPQHTILRV